MRHSATVIRVDADTLQLSCAAHVCSTCSSLFCKPQQYTFSARNDRGIELQPSDRVEYEVSTSRALAAASALFGGPPLLFLAGFLGARRATPGLPPAAVVAAGIAVVLLCTAVYWYRRGRRQSQPDMPTVVRKLPASGSSTAS